MADSAMQRPSGLRCGLPGCVACVLAILLLALGPKRLCQGTNCRGWATIFAASPSPVNADPSNPSSRPVSTAPEQLSLPVLSTRAAVPPTTSQTASPSWFESASSRLQQLPDQRHQQPDWDGDAGPDGDEAPEVVHPRHILDLDPDKQPDPTRAAAGSGNGSRRQQASSRPSSCPQGCTEYGTCNEELGRCDCPRNRDGPDCGRKVFGTKLLERCRSQGYVSIKECRDPEQSCLNNCTNHGSCQAGFCHCNPGHFGTDCSLSLDARGRPQLLASHGYRPRHKRPLVYVYELPPNLTVWFNFRRLDRPLHMLLWQRLLSSGARTADGDTADYYFIPVKLRSFMDSLLLEDAVRYIRQHYPWWNRTGGGHRHFVVQTGDWGRAEASVEAQELTWNVSWLTHWGLTQTRPVNRWSASYRPEKDLVIPVYISPGHFPKFEFVRTPLHPTVARRSRDKPRNATQLFFAGRVCHDPKHPSPSTWPACGDDTAEWYGAGVREKVFVAHWNRSSFHVVRSEQRYGMYLAQSVYCLAPPGAGHGQRQIQALFMGCVPVCVGDHISEPFEPAVSWNEWGLHVAEADIPRLHNILAAVAPEELAAKRARMHCAAQHMLYSSITGGILGEDGAFDAFETILELLRVRAAHPDARQEDFRSLDPDFAAFMECGEPPNFKHLSPSALPLRPAEGGASGSGLAAAGVAEGAGSEGQPGNGTATPAVAAVAGMGEGGGTGAGPSPSPARPPVLLCSHAAVDLRWSKRTCNGILRGSGYFGVPGGALCARGYRHRLADCPRLWE